MCDTEKAICQSSTFMKLTNKKIRTAVLLSFRFPPIEAEVASAMVTGGLGPIATNGVLLSVKSGTDQGQQ